MPLKSDLRDRMLGYTEEIRVIRGKIMSVVPSLAAVGIMLTIYVNFNIQIYFYMFRWCLYFSGLKFDAEVL